jgi:hypothetical protein
MTRKSENAESTAAISKHHLPMSRIRTKDIAKFVDSARIPDAQKALLKGTSAGNWRKAASDSGAIVGHYATGLYDDEKVPHYDMQQVAIHLLTKGSGNSAADKQSREATSYHPLNKFNNRRR